MTTPLIIRQLSLGPMDNFIYLIADQTTKEAVIIDPAWDSNTIINELNTLACQPKAIWLTHGHHDHTNAIPDILTHYPTLPIYISTHEIETLKPNHPNKKDVLPNQSLSIGTHTFTCLHTPGHTPGGQCFYSAPHLIAGDTLFIDGCGRVDLGSGNADHMYTSLHNTLFKLPDTTLIYPGHNYGPSPTDTLQNQKKTNPYLTATSKKSFIRKRKGL